MRLTIGQVFDAMQALDAILRDRRPMPQLGKFHLGRMHRKLMPEFLAANAQREELIEKHGDERDGGGFEVPPENMPAFRAEWKPIADAEIDVDVGPIPLAALNFGTVDEPVNGSIEASEIVLLGELVTW